MALRHGVRRYSRPEKRWYFDFAIVTCEQLLFGRQRCKTFRALNARDQMRVDLLEITRRQLTVQIFFQQFCANFTLHNQLQHTD